MSVENLTAIDIDTVNKLKTVLSNITLTSTGRRLGENGINNMSVYETSRWFDWTKSQVEAFKDAFDSSHVQNAIVGWYLHLPANTGFLDVMDYWVDKPDSGTVVAYSLTDANTIVINGVQHTCNAGEGIKFSLRNKHEIKTNTSARDWACLMLLQ